MENVWYKMEICWLINDNNKMLVHGLWTFKDKIQPLKACVAPCFCWPSPALPPVWGFAASALNCVHACVPVVRNDRHFPAVSDACQ
jgi:hypothetical protein